MTFLMRKGGRSPTLIAGLWAVLYVLLQISAAHAGDNAPKSILILHSYHPTLSWTDSVAKGMQDALTVMKDSVQTHVEYMDMRRNIGPEYRRKMQDLLFDKLAHKRFDLVLLSDNDALDFLLGHRARMAPEAPVIFCGINNFIESTVAGNKNITGVAEEVSLHETLDAALKLHPGTKEIVVIGRTAFPADRANRDAFVSLLRTKKYDVEYTFWDDFTANRLRSSLPSLQKGSVVFINGLTSDETGRQWLYDETTRLIRESSKVPLYSLWDVYLGHGIVGGKLVSGYLQGNLAGKLAVRVLSGDDPNKIPVARSEAANRFMFDYREMSRFGLSAKDLPEGSEVVHTPPTFYVVHKMYIWGGIVFLLIFGCMIVLLTLILLMRKRAREATRRWAEEKAVMAEIGRIIGSTLHIEDVYSRFAEAALKLMQFDRMAINTVPEETTVSNSYVWGIEVKGRQPGEVFPMAGSLTRETVDSRASKLIQTDDSKEVLERYPALDTTLQAGLRSVLAVPLISQDRIVGVLHVQSRKAHAYTAEDVKLAERIGDQIAGAIANAQLFTERKRMEDALRESEAQFRSLFEFGNIGIAITSVEKGWLRVNPHLCHLLGYSEAELREKTWAEMTYPDDLASDLERFERMLAGEIEAYEMDKRFIRKDGSIVATHLTVSCFRNPDRSVRFVIASLLDITQRKQAEDALRESEKKYRSVIENIQDVFYRSDAEGRLLMGSLSGARMFGYDSVDEMIGLPLDSFWSDPQERRDLIEKVKEAGSVRDFDAVLKRKDGTLFNASFTTHFYYDEQGKFLGTEGIIRDITERKRAEKALRESEERFRLLVETAPYAIFVRVQDRFAYVNASAVKMFGALSADQLLGQRVIERIHPEERALAAEGMRRLDTERLELRNQDRNYLKLDGTSVLVELSAVPTVFEGKNASLAILQEIGERKRAEEALKESESRFRLLVENAPDAIFVRTGTEIAYVNPAAVRLFGASSPDDLLGRSILDRFHPDFRAIGAARIRHTDAVGGKPPLLESKYVKLDGTPVDVEVSPVPFVYEGRAGALIFVRDISERKRAEEALRESEEKFSAVVTQAKDGILFIQGRMLTFSNQALADMMGYSREEIESKPFIDLVALESRDLIAKRVQSRLKGEPQPSVYEAKLLRRDGRVVDVELSAGVIQHRGKPTDVGIIRDITERKRAEEEMRRLRNYLENIINSMPSVLVGVGPEGKVTQWNAAAERMTGVGAAKALGRPLDQVLPRLSRELEKVRAAIRDRAVKSETRVARMVDGETRYEDMTVYPLVTNGVEGVVIRVDDVTERVRIEEMMIQSEKMLSVGGLAAGMAHEINNPLGVILQASQNVLRRVSPDLAVNARVAEECGTTLGAVRRYLEKREIPVFLEDIRQSGQRAAEIVANMLSFSRKADAGGSSTNLVELLDRTVELAGSDYDLKKRHDFRQIEIIREYSPDVPRVVCQSSKIQQVFLNILRNGAEAMRGTGSLGRAPRFILRLRREEASVRVEIEDNGPGMDEATRKRLFEPFFTTKPPGLGTGLGLSVSYFIITEDHGGTIVVESSPGDGARFIIELPLAGRSRHGSLGT
jgi:PAS domain S-box-containing protein